MIKYCRAVATYRHGFASHQHPWRSVIWRWIQSHIWGLRPAGQLYSDLSESLEADPCDAGHRCIGKHGRQPHRGCNGCREQHLPVANNAAGQLEHVDIQRQSALQAQAYRLPESRPSSPPQRRCELCFGMRANTCIYAHILSSPRPDSLYRLMHMTS